MIRLLAGLAGVVAVVLAAPAAAAAATACGEACLLGIAGRYMDAMTASDPAAAPFAAKVRATENGAERALTEGLWKSGTGWGYRHTFVDTKTGQIGAFGSVREGPDAEAMVAIRLKVADRKITESELLVVRKGDFSLLEPRWAPEPKAVFKEVVPADRRATRAELEAIPGKYFRAIAEGNPDLFPVHPDAVRVENGFQTTSNPKFAASATIYEGLRRLVYMQTARGLRTPVVDVERGLVLAIVAIDMPEMERTLTIHGKPVPITSANHRLPRTLILYELFKVEGGLVTGIEAVMRNGALGAEVGW